jgi:ABC-2 type transport system permease protein
MINLSQTIWIETLKARRSKMPLLTALAFMLAPFAGGFFIFIMKDPDLARRMGVISLKAQIIAGSADWPTFLSILVQAIAIGGFILFSLIASWVFGREYADHTVSDLLALPTPRTAIVLAKFMLFALWSAILVLFITLIGLGVGWLLALPPVPASLFWQNVVTIAVTTLLTILLIPPIAFFASAGRGYLPPMGAAILALILAQLLAAAGWGDYFPWSIPAIYAGMAGPDYASIGWPNFLIVLITGVVGLLATLAYWQMADQTD